MPMTVTKNAVNIAVYAREIHDTALYQLIDFPSTEFITALYLFFKRDFVSALFLCRLEIGRHVIYRISNVWPKKYS